MKQTNKFELLPETEQKMILDLCEQHTYARVVEILYQPRSDGGLDLLTSPSSLCRFYLHHHQKVELASASTQFAHALQVRRQQAPGACLAGILALLEQRLLDSLRQGRPLSDLSTEIRLLKTVHSVFLADEKFRRENKNWNAAYQEYIENQASSPLADFLRADLESDPGAGDLGESDFFEETAEDMDIVERRLAQCAERKAHDEAVLRRQAEAAAESQENSNSLPPDSPVIPPISSNSNAATPSCPVPNPASAQKPGQGVYLPSAHSGIEQFSTLNSTKHPAISQIPPNFTSSISSPSRKRVA